MKKIVRVLCFICLCFNFFIMTYSYADFFDRGQNLSPESMFKQEDIEFNRLMGQIDIDEDLRLYIREDLGGIVRKSNQRDFDFEAVSFKSFYEDKYSPLTISIDVAKKVVLEIYPESTDRLLDLLLDEKTDNIECWTAAGMLTRRGGSVEDLSLSIKETKNDGNSFFHSVFGEQQETEGDDYKKYVDIEAARRRMAYANWLASLGIIKNIPRFSNVDFPKFFGKYLVSQLDLYQKIESLENRVSQFVKVRELIDHPSRNNMERVKLLIDTLDREEGETILVEIVKEGLLVDESSLREDIEFKNILCDIFRQEIGVYKVFYWGDGSLIAGIDDIIKNNKVKILNNFREKNKKALFDFKFNKWIQRFEKDIERIRDMKREIQLEKQLLFFHEVKTAWNAAFNAAKRLEEIKKDFVSEMKRKIILEEILGKTLLGKEIFTELIKDVLNAQEELKGRDKVLSVRLLTIIDRRDIESVITIDFLYDKLIKAFNDEFDSFNGLGISRKLGERFDKYLGIYAKKKPDILVRYRNICENSGFNLKLSAVMENPLYFSSFLESVRNPGYFFSLPEVEILAYFLKLKINVWEKEETSRAIKCFHTFNPSCETVVNIYKKGLSYSRFITPEEVKLKLGLLEEGKKGLSLAICADGNKEAQGGKYFVTLKQRESNPGFIVEESKKNRFEINAGIIEHFQHALSNVETILHHNFNALQVLFGLEENQTIVSLFENTEIYIRENMKTLSEFKNGKIYISSRLLEKEDAFSIELLGGLLLKAYYSKNISQIDAIALEKNMCALRIYLLLNARYPCERIAEKYAHIEFESAKIKNFADVDYIAFLDYMRRAIENKNRQIQQRIESRDFKINDFMDVIGTEVFSVAGKTASLSQIAQEYVSFAWTA